MRRHDIIGIHIYSTSTDLWLEVVQRACTGGAAPIVLTVVDTSSTNIPSSQFSKIANIAQGRATFKLQQVL